MKFFAGVTDIDWFEYLAARGPDEVNFWRPSDVRFGAVEPGAPFLFKLRSPANAIAGGGFFVRYAMLPLSIVWDAFGEKNGVPDHAALLAKIRGYRQGPTGPDPLIGSIVLAEPFFFDRADWIPQPADWSPNIVTGKGYDTADEIGARLWSEVQARLMVRSDRRSTQQLPLDPAQIAEPRWREYLTRQRLGQGAFRVGVTEAYQRRCAVTGERTLPILQASHIKPYSAGGPHNVSNGLLLRADVHILFDLGYLTVTDDHRVRVSPRIRHDYGNGRDYYAMDERPLVVLPEDVQERPSAEFLKWHRRNRYAA